MPPSERSGEVIAGIVSATTVNERVRLIRQVPEKFGKAEHQEIYSEIAKAVYVKDLSPDFAFVHWREDYELEDIERAYTAACEQTRIFENTSPQVVAATILEYPATLRIFRLLLGLTTQEFAAATLIVASQTGQKPILNGTVKNIEIGKPISRVAAALAATVIDQAMQGQLFGNPPKGLRSKIDKPDTRNGWQTVRLFARERVPLEVFLHQRHYGGSFRQLLDATSSLRGDVVEQAVEELFSANGIQFVRTGSSNQSMIARKFSLTLKPAPDFVIHDPDGMLGAVSGCVEIRRGDISDGVNLSI